MKRLKKILLIISIVIFPLGMLFCIGKNLFTKDFAGFLGGLFLLVIGGIASLYIFTPNTMSPITNFFKWLF